MLYFTENISDLPKVTHRACQTQIIGSEGSVNMWSLVSKGLFDMQEKKLG